MWILVGWNTLSLFSLHSIYFWYLRLVELGERRSRNSTRLVQGRRMWCLLTCKRIRMEFVVVLSIFLIRVERTVERFISPDYLGNIWFLRERDGALPRN